MTDERAQIKEITKELEEFTGDQISKLTLDIQNELERDTPVDSGHARSNWIPSVGGPHEGVAGSRTNVSTVEQEQGKAELAGYSIKQGPAYITNNVSYAGILAFLQRPGLITTAIQRALLRLR